MLDYAVDKITKSLFNTDSAKPIVKTIGGKGMRFSSSKEKEIDPLAGQTPLSREVSLRDLTVSDAIVAATGAELLDKHIPNWHENPELHEEGYWTNKCDPGDALFENYSECISWVRQHTGGNRMRNYGFIAAYGNGWKLHNTSIASLRAAWRTQIEIRIMCAQE